MDFSKYYKWDESQSKEWNLKEKLLWTNNAREAFEQGLKAYHDGKNIRESPFASIAHRLQTPIDPLIEQQGDALLQHSLDPTNSMNKIYSRFSHNLKWWERGWKSAYRSHACKA